LNATHRISTWANRIKTGQLYQYQGATWVANVVNYTFFNGYVQGKVSFVQNFNALALRTQLLREKRMSNISKELVQKSEEILTDFIYFSSRGINYAGEEIHFNKDYLGTFIRDSFNIVGPYSKIGDVVYYFMTNDPLTNVFAIYIPTIKYGAGNTINIEVGFEHPMNAGNKTDAIRGWINNSYFTRPILYTDKNGFLDEINIKAPINAPAYDNNFPFVQVYPYDDAQGRGAGYFDIRAFKIYKQPNEIFALNYQLAFLPIPGRENIDFIGNEWINNNCFVKDFEESKKARYIVFKEAKSSNLDIKATDYFLKQEITRVSLSSSFALTKHTILLYFSGLTYDQMQRTISWAIVDERDNILFASNSKLEYSNRVDIEFVSYKNRLS
jgi:hypothetical protein